MLEIADQPLFDNLESGLIRIGADGFPDIVTRIITFTPLDRVYTDITEAEWDGRPILDGMCTFSDDDLYEEADFLAQIVGSDIGIGSPPNGYLPLPDTSELQQVYHPAYITPVVEHQHASQGAYPFYKNFYPEERTNWDPGRLLLRGLPVSTAEFWTVYVFSAFQPERSADCDSEAMGTKGACTHGNGDTSPPWNWADSYTGMAAIFSETLRDGYSDVQVPRTVAHEIAHTLGAPHLGAYAIPGDGGLMDETEQGAAFLPESLKTLREYAQP